MVPSLVEKCTKYLCDNVTGSDVFSNLLQAQKFENRDLEDRCWEVIERQTEESLVKREVLSVTEVELFKAVDRWATEEGQRQGIIPIGKTKRRLLGEEIVKGIRFPLMSLAEFATVVDDTAILSRKETGDMMKCYSNVPLYHFCRKQGKSFLYFESTDLTIIMSQLRLDG